MEQLNLTPEILQGIEPRFYNLFSELVEITHTVVFDERPKHRAAPYEPLFNNVRNEHFKVEGDVINYIVEYDLGNDTTQGKITVAYYKPRGVVFVAQEIVLDRRVRGSVMYIYESASNGINKSENRFFNQHDMKTFWYYWLHKELAGIPPNQIQKLCFEKKKEFLEMKQLELAKFRFLSLSLAKENVKEPRRAHSSAMHYALRDPDILYNIAKMGMNPDFRPYVSPMDYLAKPYHA
jgi:hypothetical protein